MSSCSLRRLTLVAATVVCVSSSASRLPAQLAAQLVTPVAATIPTSPPAVRLRVAWGGGQEPRAWRGRISLSDGVFTDIQLLGMDADAAGSIWQDAGVIHIDSLRPHRFDGFDVTVSSSEQATLRVELSTSGMSSPVTVNLPVAEIAKAAARQELDAEHDVLLLHRTPGDSIQIEMDRDSLIFAPGEEFALHLRPGLGQLIPGTTVDLAVTLAPARSSVTVWNIEQRLPVPVQEELVGSVTVPLPRAEGVYNLRMAFADPPGFARFVPGGRGKTIAERTLQVVVMNLSPAASEEDTTWQTVWEIDPSNRRWWQRIPSWAQRLPYMPQGPLGSTDANAIEHVLGRFVELAPTVAGGEPQWQAYPLPIQHAGVPHVVEVEYPADSEQHLGLSVVEPNAAGRAMPIGRDSGVYVEKLGASERKNLHAHRLLFWPRTNSPLLLVSNLHPSAPATYGRIRVERVGGLIGGANPREPWQSAERLVAAYIARPLVPETFGASESLADAAAGQSVDDLQTHLEAAKRLSEYLPYAGYNAAVVSVMADGSAIFPSRNLLSTPLYDTGRTIGGGRGAPPSDPLEIMLRVFDRDSHALIPALQLGTPLPKLEALRRNTDSQQSGLEWVDAEGKTWLETQSVGRGQAPYYNLLDERVQQAILELVDEILARYGHHAALAGITIQLSSDGFGQLPGLNWGYDDATIAQFEREMRIALAPASGPGRFAARHAQLTRQYANEWRTWRAARVTRFYQRVAQLVTSSGPQRRLFLTTEEMFASPRFRNQLRPSVLDKVSVDELMLELGIDHLQLSRSAGIVFCPAQFIEPAFPLVDRAVDMELNETTAELLERGGETTGLGAAFFHRPSRTRLTSFDAKSPWPSSTWLVSQSLEDASDTRKRFARTLETGDPNVFLDGGELLPMGQEAATRPLLSALQMLPSGVPFRVLKSQPVTMRVYESSESLLVALINDCPWPAAAEVTFDLPSGAEVLNSTSDAAPMQLPVGTPKLPLALAPYDVQIFKLNAAGARVTSLAASVSDTAKSELNAKLAAVNNRDLTRRSEYQKLANPDFEAHSLSGPLPGWQIVGNPTDTTAELDATSPHGGATCLYLASRGTRSIVASEPFTTPATGQLFLTAWLRGENLSSGAAVRLVLEADDASQPYRKFADTQQSHPLSGDWKFYGFSVNDLPLDSEGKLKVKFELEGTGEIWVDDVKLYDLLFPEKSYENAKDEKRELVITLDAAQKAQEDGRIADCVRVLESYWPRFLLEYTSAVEPAPIVARQPPITPIEESEVEAADAAESPSILRRMWPWNWR